MILLHVGLAKTGTTAFQNALNRHKDALRECGVVVPFAEEHEPHTVAAHLLTGEIARRADVVRLRGLPLSDWLSRLDPSKCCIISSEYFGHCEAALLRGYFSTFDPDVRIVFLARSQASLLLSGYFQDVAHQSDAHRITDHVMMPELDHGVRYQSYVSTFGADAVMCEWYGNLLSARQSLLSFVLSRLGIADGLNADALSDALDDTTVSNASMADEVVDLLRYCNEVGLTRCKALVLAGTFKFPVQFAAYRRAVTDALVSHYAEANLAFSAAANVQCPEQARAPAQNGAPKKLTWPPQLSGCENIYAMLHTIETQLAEAEENRAVALASGVPPSGENGAGEYT